MRLLELFTLLAVLISMLGLLAMSTYFADENTKQIAIRKVFGADVNSETWRNERSYMILVSVACLISISLAIAFGTVLWQTLKAAKTNPATELKKE